MVFYLNTHCGGLRAISAAGQQGIHLFYNKTYWSIRALILFTLLAQSIFSAPFDDEDSTSLSGSVELTALDAIPTTVMPMIIPSTVKGEKISEDIYNLTPS